MRNPLIICKDGKVLKKIDTGLGPINVFVEMEEALLERLLDDQIKNKVGNGEH